MSKTRCYALYLLGTVPELWPLVGLDESAANPKAAVQAAADQLAVLIEQWWAAWQAHPDFAASFCKEPTSPVVLATFAHPPGLQGRCHSYYVSALQSVTCPATLKWAKRAWDGTLSSIEPVPFQFPVDPYRDEVLAFALKGAGTAWRARSMLKEMLPRELRRLVSLARKWKGRRKSDFLPIDEPPDELQPGQPGRLPLYMRRQDWPQWYRDNTKAQLWVDRVLEPADRRALSQFIDPLDFWRAATGQVPLDKVAALFKQRQLSLGLDEEVPDVWYQLQVA